MVIYVGGVSLGKVQELRGHGPVRLLTPSLFLPTIYDLPTSWLRERLVQAIISDLDNTLVPWRDYRVAEQLAGWFRSLHAEGFRTVILSNTRPSPTVQRLSEELQTDVVLGARKPVQRFFRQALDKVGASPSQACVIGDQVFTDVLGGNLMGCYTVLVKRIGDREFAGTRLMRVFERMVLGYLRRRGLAAPYPSESRDAGPAGLDDPPGLI